MAGKEIELPDVDCEQLKKVIAKAGLRLGKKVRELTAKEQESVLPEYFDLMGKTDLYTAEGVRKEYLDQHKISYDMTLIQLRDTHCKED